VDRVGNENGIHAVRVVHLLFVHVQPHIYYSDAYLGLFVCHAVHNYGIR
jgi:hypothetical protein